jgi:basic membrane lipoprotein Med (substrate-binding protein (PBP1-ABC) superfamily)
MDLKDKIIGMALVALISLVGWNLHETWGMKEEVFKLQQGQVVLSKQIKKNSAFVKQKLKQLKKKKDKKVINQEIKKNKKKNKKKKKLQNE